MGDVRGPRKEGVVITDTTPPAFHSFLAVIVLSTLTEVEWIH